MSDAGGDAVGDEAARPELTAPPELTALAETDRLGALERFRLLRPHLEEGRALSRVGREAGVPYRTAQRWASLYRRFGLAALARKGQADRGARRALSPQMQRAVEGLVLQRPPPPVALDRQVCRLARQQGGRPPSYVVVYDVVRHLPADLTTLAHQGAGAYADTYELVHRREADRPNAVWQADHTLLDVLLVREGGGAARPWLTVILDQAVWRKGDPRWHVCGIPDVFYTDNGSDFTSRHMEQVAADLKMRLVFSTPAAPVGGGASSASSRRSTPCSSPGCRATPRPAAGSAAGSAAGPR